MKQFSLEELAAQYNAALGQERELWRQLSLTPERTCYDEHLLAQWCKSAADVNSALAALLEAQRRPF